MNYDFGDVHVDSEDIRIVEIAQKILSEGSGLGSEYLGWRNSYAEYMSSSELDDIKETAKKIRTHSNAVIVLGIGGSYLGSKAVISSVLGEHYNTGADVELYFGGNNISEENYAFLRTVILSKEVSVIVISKSGKTMETMLAFEKMLEFMYDKYGEDNSENMYERIYAITDEKRGILKKFSDPHRIKTFVVPSDVGGRYSVFTPVGLLPLCIAGIDIDEFLCGATDMQASLAKASYEDNPAMQYACARLNMYRKGFASEVLLTYSPANFYLTEWWKQLFGESEGKDGKGLFPCSLRLTTDLHSLGQFLQDGKKMFFETHMFIEKRTPRNSLKKYKCSKKFYRELGLDNIENKKFEELNTIAYKSVLKAHRYAGNVNICLEMTSNSEREIGSLMYFFMESCAISAYALGVNPFNQDGVEAYKNNMRELL